MNAEWMSDARKIPDEVMNYLRRIAVLQITHNNQWRGLRCSSQLGIINY